MYYYDFAHGYASNRTIRSTGFIKFKKQQVKAKKVAVLCTKCGIVYFIGHKYYIYYASKSRRLCKKCQAGQKHDKRRETQKAICEETIHPVHPLTLRDPYPPYDIDNQNRLTVPPGAGEHWGLVIGMR